jgi:hypothetical protein
MMKIDYTVWDSIKGFMDRDEAERLYRIALKASERGPVVEIGSYCGKSAYIIGSACKANNAVLYSIDHHKGSEEQQPDEAYFDPDLFDPGISRINTFPFFQETLVRTGLDDTVVPIVAASCTAGKMWDTPISMLFIDGGHSFDAVQGDYLTWAGHIQPHGFLVIHDIFRDPAKGGQAPCQVYDMALESGAYDALEMINTLGVLRKIRMEPS